MNIAMNSGSFHIFPAPSGCMIFSNQLDEIHPNRHFSIIFSPKKTVKHSTRSASCATDISPSQAIREKLQQPGQGKNLIAGTKAGFVKTRWISIEFGERNVFFFENPGINPKRPFFFLMDGNGETAIFPW